MDDEVGTVDAKGGLLPMGDMSPADTMGEDPGMDMAMDVCTEGAESVEDRLLL